MAGQTDHRRVFAAGATGLSRPGGTAPGIVRIRDLFGGLFASMSGIATAPDPNQASFEMVQRRVKDPNADAVGALRADSPQRPDPIRTVETEIVASSWSALLKLGYEHVNNAWKRDVVPLCEGVIFQRYPMFPRRPRMSRCAISVTSSGPAAWSMTSIRSISRHWSSISAMVWRRRASTVSRFHSSGFAGAIPARAADPFGLLHWRGVRSVGEVQHPPGVHVARSAACDLVDGWQGHRLSPRTAARL